MKISFVSREDMAGSLAHSNGPSHYFHAGVITMLLWHSLQASSKGEQVAEGTHRLLEPVSKMTLKPWPGVPSSMGP